MATAALFSATLLAALQLAPAAEGHNIPEDLLEKFNATAFSSGAEGKGSAGGSSTVTIGRGRCFAFSFGYSEKKNEEAIASAATEVTSYICDPGPEDPEQVESIADATATAFAIAVAEASVGCEGEGNVNYIANAKSSAKSTAEVWLKAYASAVAAADCEKCDAYAQSYGYIEEQVFLKAVAEAEATVEGYSTTDFKGFSESARQYNKDVQKATATAFAKSIAGAKKYHEGNDCFAWTNAGGCIWTPSAEDPDECFECVALSIGATRISKINALAEASAAAGAYTCGNDTSAASDAYVAASAIAEATAEAISLAYAKCETDDGAFACSTSLAAAEDTAYAVAEAFAMAWAEGYTCDDSCTVKANDAVKVIGDILVTATTSALADVCAANGEEFAVSVLAESIEKASVEAVAVAIAEAVVGKECYAAALVDVVLEEVL